MPPAGAQNLGTSLTEKTPRALRASPAWLRFGGGTGERVGIPNPGGRRESGEKEPASAPEAEQQPEERRAARPAGPQPPAAGGRPGTGERGCPASPQKKENVFTFPPLSSKGWLSVYAACIIAAASVRTSPEAAPSSFSVLQPAGENRRRYGSDR